MRMFLILLCALPVAGCTWSAELIATTVMGAHVGSIAAIHRTPEDALYSLVTGKDCSVVRLDQGKSYCRPVEPPPETPPYCTRSLGVVDCWQDPDTVPGDLPGVADGPSGLTPAQEANRTRTWP